jgi:molecular chaperone GrpE (heat shock protein)
MTTNEVRDLSAAGETDARPESSSDPPRPRRKRPVQRTEAVDTDLQDSPVAVPEHQGGIDAPGSRAEDSISERLISADSPDEPISDVVRAGECAYQDRAAIALGTTIADLSDRISALEARTVEHRNSLAAIGDSIAVEVERITTDELVDAKQRLSLAVNSMAHMALAMSESAQTITEGLSPDSTASLLYSFHAEVDNILLQLGYEPIGTRAGEKFDPTRHRSLRRVTTRDRNLDKSISRVIRDGYRSKAGNRTLLYADVEVSRYQEEQPHQVAAPGSSAPGRPNDEQGDLGQSSIPPAE